ncbi:helix-turn-helix domain-containing protein [Anaerotignum sp.]
MGENNYDAFVRNRITELRLKKNVSEHKMSLDLGKSGAYIRSITNGTALPSLKELFNIMAYFNMNPAEFFSPTEDKFTTYFHLCEQLRTFDEDDLKKVQTFISWIEK